ncbi:MAG: FAD-binding oxidoreductase [Granulosicoccus sp.]
MEKELLDTLRAIVGESNVLDSKQVRERATHFWDSSPLNARALVRPANTQETSAVLSACHAANQVVVTHGGVTGLVNGNHSTEHNIILSLERQQAIENVDAVGRTISVQAGAILQNVQQAAEEAGLQLGLDLGARGSCTVGGNVATNAGGLSVLRYGMAREQVLGLEAVLADGTIVSSMNRMMKNNAGYDLKQLFIGSEGTLGIITRVVFRLRAATPVIRTTLMAFDNFDSVSTTLRQLDTALNGTLDAFEVIWQPFYRLNTDPDRTDTARSPLSRDFSLYAIAESRSASGTASDDVLEQTLAQLMDDGFLLDAVVAKSETEAANIWHIREHIDIALEHDPIFVYDISLPIADMQAYVSQLENDIRQLWPTALIYVYGHLADGNLHVLVAPPAIDVDASALQKKEQDDKNKIYQQWHKRSNQIVYGPLQDLGGSISAEHGIGLYKKPYLSMSRNTTEIQLMKVLKQTLDPKGILNRGKIVDLDL